MNVKTDFPGEFIERREAAVRRHACAARRLDAEGDHHAAVLEKIRGNVHEIFRALCVSTLEKGVSGRLPNPAIREILREYPDPREQAVRIYFWFLDIVTDPWKKSLDRALEHDDAEAEMKERVKLEVAEVIREDFARSVEAEWGIVP